MDHIMSKQPANIALNKLLLGMGGFFFSALALFMLALLAQSGPDSAGDTALFLFLFLAVGIGFFLTLDWYTTKYDTKKPARLYVPSDDEEGEAGENGEDGGIFEGEQPFQPGMVVQASSGEGGERLNHLEMADYLFGKIRDLATAESIPPLISKAVEDLRVKGYSAKGLDAFYNRLLGHLATIREGQATDQAVQNRNAAMDAVRGLRG